jgi:acid phosphatase (class A)
MTMKRISFLPPLLAALGLAACAAHQAARPSPYVTPGYSYMQESAALGVKLGPPPSAGSAEDSSDLAEVRRWQVQRSPQECARAASETDPAYDSFFGGVSPFPRPMPASAAAFFQRVRSDTFNIVERFKGEYARTRPYGRESALHPCIQTPDDDRYSYPSGHSTLSRVLGLVLSDLVPARRAEFLARADEVALDRVIGGVHHPSDIAAGKLLADEIHAELLKSPGYLADLEKVRPLLKSRP